MSSPVKHPAQYSGPRGPRRLLRKLNHAFWSACSSIRNARYRGINDHPGTVFWVSPCAIQYRSGFHHLRDRGRVVGGDWDALDDPFESYDFYQSFKRHVAENVPWQKLPFYERLLSEKGPASPEGRASYQQRLDRKCQEWDAIFQDIKLNGFAAGVGDAMEGDEYIQVNVGRHGDLMLSEGGHRLTFAKVLELESIPVRVTVRHAEWVRFKRGFTAWAKREWSEGAYVSLPHIDLQRIPFRFSEATWELVKQGLGLRGGTALDLRARFGYFCVKLEELGFVCTAVESEAPDSAFLRQVRRCCNKSFATVDEPLISYARKSDRLAFDVVLAFDVAHRFLKTRASYADLTEILCRLDARELYLQAHLRDEPEMRDAYANLAPEELVQMVSDATSLERSQLLGTDDDGRPIYRLSRA